MLELDDIQHILLTRTPGADGALRVPLVRRRRPAAGPGCRASSTRCGRPQTVASPSTADDALGDGGLHLERPAGARRGRGVAGHVSRGVPPGHGGARGDPRRHRREPSRPLGRRARQPGPPRHRRSSSPATTRSASAASASTTSLLAAVRRRRGALVPGSRGDPAVRLRARPLRLPRPAVAAGDRGTGDEPTPGSGAPLKPASSSSAIPTKTGRLPACPQPEILSRNGSYLAYRRLQEHVGAFRDFLRAARRRRPRSRSWSRRS